MRGKDLAVALGISEQMVSKLRRRGMPTDSVEAAHRWRRRHLEPGRMKGERVDTILAPAKVRPKPASAPAPASDQDLLWAEVVRVAVLLPDRQDPLPAPLGRHFQALLQRLSPARFAHLWTPIEGQVAIERVCPQPYLEWSWASPHDDCVDDVPAADLELLQLLASGRASIDYQRGAAWRPFRECVRLDGGGWLDLDAARQEFEQWRSQWRSGQ